jgi:hypothetical protein
MLKRKTRVPVIGLFDWGYKFSYFFVKVYQNRCNITNKHQKKNSKPEKAL